MAVQIDLTTLSGYESLAAGTYALAVKAKAANYQDSDLSSTVSFTKLAAPVATAADTTVTWEAVTNAESYDVYVDGELYENTTGGTSGYNVTLQGVNGGTSTGGSSIMLDTNNGLHYYFDNGTTKKEIISDKVNKLTLTGYTSYSDVAYSIDGSTWIDLIDWDTGEGKTIALSITEDCTIYLKTTYVD